MGDPVAKELIENEQDNERKKSAQETLENSLKKERDSYKKIGCAYEFHNLDLIFSGKKRKFYGIGDNKDCGQQNYNSYC